jgi:hypothetical protein
MSHLAAKKSNSSGNATSSNDERTSGGLVAKLPFSSLRGNLSCPTFPAKALCRRDQRGKSMNGRCLCGSVRYEFSGDPSVVCVCHCKHCQQTSGSAFSLVCAVPRQAIHMTGNIEVFHDKADSGNNVLRSFCPDCGSPIVSELAATPELVWIKAGTLEDTTDLKPSMEIFCASAQPWVHLQNLKRFDGMPEL